MKELVRFLGYTGATVAIILFVIFMARFDNESGSLLPIIAFLMVIVLPVVVGVFMGRREQAKRLQGEKAKGEK